MITSPAAAAHARRAAAEALASCGDADSLAALWSALAASPQPDRMLEHSLVFAAHHLADASALKRALDHPHPRVQAAALLLLDQPPRPAGALVADAAFERLAAGDEYLRQVALQCVERHPEWAARAAALVRDVGAADLAPDREARLLRLLLAFEQNADVQAIAARHIANGSPPAERRVRLLEILAQSRLAETPAAIADALAKGVDDPDARVAGAAVKTAAVRRPKRLDDRLAVLASDTSRPTAQRLDALRAVLPRRPKLDVAAFALLLSRLGADAEPLDRLTAASLVGQAKLDEKQAAALLERVGRDNLVAPPAVLPAIVDVSGESFRRALVAYVKSAADRGWEPTDDQLAPLLERLGPGQDAEALRAMVREAAERRGARLAEYEPLLAGGDPARGRSVFFGNKVACGTCHRVGSEGGLVGPDLTKVGAVRAGRDILESVVLPSSTIAQGYDHYVVQTKAGEVHAGIVPQPSADVLDIRDSGGNVVRVHKGEVARLKRQPMSLMPDGLPAALTREEFRDLLAYLQSLR
jgi:putative heme-binding domain-containing protein